MAEVGVLLGIAALGGSGAVLRFALDGIVERRARGDFPAGTLTVNLSGSAVAGFLVGAGAGGDASLLLLAGFVGSFTTFSTWLLEAQRLAEEGALRTGALNLAVSFLAGLAAAAVGRALGELL
ncbi:MAG: fluoride efflux transporter CrcB [Actinobacteria bacterium]|nr:fluoride efflux transporter CrcB [Actinomycetota bacterium]